MRPFSITGKGVVIRVVVRPESGEERLVFEGDELVFYTEEPPIKGRANAALLKYLSRTLGVPTSRLEIVHGARSRVKSVLVKGMGEEDIRSRIEKVAFKES